MLLQNTLTFSQLSDCRSRRRKNKHSDIGEWVGIRKRRAPMGPPPHHILDKTRKQHSTGSCTEVLPWTKLRLLRRQVASVSFWQRGNEPLPAPAGRLTPATHTK